MNEVSDTDLGTSAREQGGRHLRDLYVFRFWQTSHRYGASHFAIFEDRNAAAPSCKTRIAEIADIETVLGVAGRIPDFLRRFALARGAVSLIHCNIDGRYLCTSHPGEKR